MTQETTVFAQHGLVCPECKTDTHLDILIMHYVRLVTDGVSEEAAHDYQNRGYEWDDTSTCYCDNCGYRGTVGEFRPEEPEATYNGVLFKDLSTLDKERVNQGILEPDKPE
jgi:hypothetical protein